MKNKIILIRPENVYRYNNYPPLNLICLGSILRKNGFDVTIISSILEKDAYKTIQTELNDALVVGITMLTSEVPDALKVSNFIKKQADIPIVVGGWHCTLFPEQMANCENIDYVIMGDGEEHILDIAKNLCEGIKPEDKIYRKKTIDLDTLPVPDYTIDKNIEFFITSYLMDQFSQYVKHPIRWLPYESSRGCPSECAFCINVVTENTRYRKKSSKKVVSEIVQIVNQFKLTHLKIIDDNFFVDIKRAREISEGIVENGLDITWDAECRCDYFNDRQIDDDTLRLLKKSGLIQLTLGIESGSQQTLDLMKKHIKVQQAENAVIKCNQYGIIARSSFMIEVPGETMDDIQKTIKFINKLRKYPFFSCGVTTFRPYPKCELSEKLLKNGFLTEPQNCQDWLNPDAMAMYTAGEILRPWQVDGRYSVSACYYLNMESGSRLGEHQIDNLSDKIKNKIFTFIAKVRNRFMFYAFPVDMELYKKFFVSFYTKKQETEKGSGVAISK